MRNSKQMTLLAVVVMSYFLTTTADGSFIEEKNQLRRAYKDTDGRGLGMFKKNEQKIKIKGTNGRINSLEARLAAIESALLCLQNPCRNREPMKYIVNEAEKTFYDHENQANSDACKNGHLASIENWDDQNGVMEAINDLLPTDIAEFYIGGERSGTNSSDFDWQWTDGSPFTFTNWLTDQPSGGRNENVIILYGPGHPIRSEHSQWKNVDRQERSAVYIVKTSTNEETCLV